MTYKHMEKKRLKTEVMSSITVLLLHQISASVFLCQNILKSFSLKCLQHTLVYLMPLKSSLSVADADRLILSFQA